MDPNIPNAEKVKRCKDIISITADPEEAKTVLGWLYSIIRTDYVEDNLGEKNHLLIIYKNLEQNSET